jgi:galactose mutarotase-like enzyme
MTASAPAPSAPFGTAELRAGSTKAVIVPALGGKIVSLEFEGREWLWGGELAGRSAPVDGAPYDERVDGGGYDELFPTIAPCTLPSHITRYGGLSLPDHGELWSQPATFSLETRPEGMFAATGWQGRRMPYRFVRGVFVSNSGSVEMHYAVSNDGDARLPFVWSAQAVLPLTRSTRLVLPEGSRARVWSQEGVELGGPGAYLRWPRAVIGGKLVDLTRPEEVARAYACRIYFDPGAGRAAVESDGARLEVSFDSERVRHVALSISKPGWSAFGKRRSARTIALAPSIGSPDSLSEALGGWRDAAWLEPGETREWRLTWRGSAAESPAAESEKVTEGQ